MLISQEIKNLAGSLGFLSFAYARCTAREENRKEGSVPQSVRLSVTQTFQLTQVKHVAIFFLCCVFPVLYISAFQIPLLVISYVFSFLCFTTTHSSYSYIFSYSCIFDWCVSNRPLIRSLRRPSIFSQTESSQVFFAAPSSSSCSSHLHAVHHQKISPGILLDRFTNM